MRQLAWLLRYGPKSIRELLDNTTRFNQQLAQALGELMQEERSAWEQGLLTGDS